MPRDGQGDAWPVSVLPFHVRSSAAFLLLGVCYRYVFSSPVVGSSVSSRMTAVLGPKADERRQKTAVLLNQRSGSAELVLDSNKVSPPHGLAIGSSLKARRRFAKNVTLAEWVF